MRVRGLCQDNSWRGIRRRGIDNPAVGRLSVSFTDRRLRRGVFTSVANLIDAIDTWVEHWNDDPKPFIWHKTAEEIVAKVRRGRAALTEVKSATHD